MSSRWTSNIRAREHNAGPENRLRSPHVNPARGIGLTMTQARKRYRILRLRQLVRDIRKKCHGCKRYTVSAYPIPITGVLPIIRTQGINPYQVIGVHYAGPICYGKRNGQACKAYIVLYTCSLTRGI